MKKLSFITLAALLALNVTACKDDEEETCEHQSMRCSTDGTSLETCLDGYWLPTKCKSEFCYYSVEGPKCMDEAQNSTSSTKPITPTPVGTTNRCTSDRSGIEIVSGKDGSTTTRSCRDEVGFDAKCVEYANGLIGCELPETCDDVFSERGTCLGNRLAYCDLTYTTERPTLLDCASQGMVCGTTDIKADCFKTCGASDSEFSCTKQDGIDYVVNCKNDGSVTVKDVELSVCSGNDVVTCDGSSVKKTACASGSTCVASLGVCAENCSASQKDSVKCDSTGRMTMCQKTAEGSWAYVSVGSRECVGNILNTCSTDESGKVTVSTLDCSNQEYKYDSGEVYSNTGKCVKNLQYYQDYDVCYPVYPGKACGSVTENGNCSGTKLSYCDEDKVLIEFDCSNSSDDMTSCTVFKDVADCRKPCSVEGDVICTEYDNGDGTTSSSLSICVADQNDPSKLSYLLASAACVGSTQYTCNGSKVETLDCAKYGGVCGIMECKFPVCSIDSTTSCTDGVSCSVDDSGVATGLMTCN